MYNHLLQYNSTIPYISIKFLFPLIDSHFYNEINQISLICIIGKKIIINGSVSLYVINIISSVKIVIKENHVLRFAFKLPWTYIKKSAAYRGSRSFLRGQLLVWE